MRLALPALVFGLTLTTAVRAEDWPEFRGPTGQGISQAKGLPLHWSDTENVAWKQAVPGNGWSSPVLYRGRLYLTSAIEGGASDGQALSALCFDAATGKPVWKTTVFTTPMDKVHKKNSHASPTPIAEGDKLYVHFGHQGTACLNLEGKVLWRNEELKYAPVHGNGGSPALAGDSLVFSCDGAANPFIVALDKSTGKVRWKVKRETSAAKTFSFSTPLILEAKDGPQMISPGSGAVVAYNVKDGREIWRARYGEGYSVIPRPVFGDGLIFVSSSFDRPSVLAIKPEGKGDVTDTHVAWKAAKGAPRTPSMLVAGDELYAVDDAGIASCFDAKTGMVHWQERVGGNFSASPVYAEGRIYLQNEEGVGTVLKAGKTFEKLASNPMNERTLASYALADGAIFIRTEQNLYRIQAAKK